MRIPATLLATFLVSAVALAAGPAERQRNAPIDERALKPTSASGVTELGVTMYSGTTVGGPSWTRAFADCSGTTGLGPMTYHSQPFFVASAGSYAFASIQTGGWDGYLLLYQNNFDPNNPLTNCLGGNDDGMGGIGTSDFNFALNPGVQYFLITTGFENGEEGPFDNSIDGPGTVTLGGLGGTADLSITKTTAGVPDSGSFVYSLNVNNAGPDSSTSTVVTDTLPAGLTFVSSTCGAGAAGQVVTWNIGTLAVTSTACDITVSIDTPGCAPTTNTASVSGAVLDSNSANNSSTTSNATESVQDGSFEDGTPNAFWAEASTNFGTPLCDIGSCGTGTGTGPNSGDFWAWFGGVAAPETGSVSQTVTIPVGSNTLSFFFEAIICANTTDFVRAQIDGNTVWEANGTHPQCGSLGYQEQTVDISAFADGGSHTLAFVSTISGAPSGSNFFIDDISIAAATCVVAGPGGGGTNPFDPSIPTASEVGLMLMALLLAASAAVMLNKR